VGGVLIPAIRCADDQAMVSHTVRGLQVIMDALQNTSEKYNMRINTKKTKIMRMSTVEGKNYEGHSQWTESGKSETILLSRKFGDRRL